MTLIFHSRLFPVRLSVFCLLLLVLLISSAAKKGKFGSIFGTKRKEADRSGLMENEERKMAAKTYCLSSILKNERKRERGS